MDGGPSGFLIVIFLVGLVCLIEFFHIGWLVLKIRENSEIQTEVLRAIFPKISGQDWTGIEGKITMTPTADALGAVKVLGKEVKCISKSRIVSYGARVKIIGKDGTVLIVEPL